MPILPLGAVILAVITLARRRFQQRWVAGGSNNAGSQSSPGAKAIDRAAARCFPAFARFVGTPYAQSDLEIFYYLPTEQSWRLLGDHAITCVLGHPERKNTGSLAGSQR